MDCSSNRLSRRLSLSNSIKLVTKIKYITKKLLAPLPMNKWTIIIHLFMQKELFNKKTNLYIHLLPMNIIKRDAFKFSPKPIKINGIKQIIKQMVFIIN